MATDKLAVWSGDRKAGLLERGEQYVFNYLPGTDPAAFVSLTMPVRMQSWVSKTLHPVFQMNLPEGALLIALRTALAKIAGTDDLTILRVTGGNQIGWNRFSLPDETLAVGPGKPESLHDILTYPDAGELFNELMERYALQSGISGVQPKVVLEATERATVTSSGYIVKSWGSDFPQMGANEYFCMTVARKAGLPVPEFHLSENGGLFVMKRFDRAADGTLLGFEDLCALQALGTEQKYASSYERVAKTIRDFVSREHLFAAQEQFFSVLALSIIIRNGDAHLKNFGVLYRPGGPVMLAPVFDLVTTTAYLRHDVPALTLAGTKKWWPRKLLEKFALTHLAITPTRSAEITSRLADAVSDTRRLLSLYMADHPVFTAVGSRMLESWEDGLAAIG